MEIRNHEFYGREGPSKPSADFREVSKGHPQPIDSIHMLTEKRKTLSQNAAKKVLTKFIYIILMFLLIYNLSFRAFPSLTTGRLVILLLTLLLAVDVLGDLKHFLRANLLAVFVFVSVFLYALLLYLTGGLLDNVQLSRTFHFLLYSVWGFLLFATLLKHDLYEFVSIFSLATLIQSMFIVFSFLSPEYREWLNTVAVQAGNIPLTAASQVPGFSNSSGALLSVIQALGVFAALYSARLAVTNPVVYFYSAIALVMMGSTMITGRTGLVLSAAFFVLFLIGNRRRQALALVLLCGFGLLLSVTFSENLLSFASRYNPRALTIRDWAFQFFLQGTDTTSLSDLASQKVPPIDFQTVVGTGRAAVTWQGNASGNDSGYVQTYYALGLIMTVAFYLSLSGILIRYLYHSEDRLFWGLLVLSMFVIEIKEPFIYKYVYPFFALCAVQMSGRRRQSGQLGPHPGNHSIVVAQQ